MVNRKVIETLRAQPADLPWGSQNIDLVVESTGVFERGSQPTWTPAGGHHLACQGRLEDHRLGVNDDSLSGDENRQQRLAPRTAWLPWPRFERHLGMETGFITTIHAYTADQRLQDPAQTCVVHARPRSA